MYEDYYEDRQGKYMPKSLPNICFNVIAAIIKQKQSTICESPVQLDYFTDSSQQDSQTITRFIAFALKTMGFEKALRRGVKWSLVRMNDYLHFLFTVAVDPGGAGFAAFFADGFFEVGDGRALVDCTEK